MKKLVKTIEKYCDLDFLNDYLKNSFTISDEENIFFKYPENSTKLIVEYSNLSKNISKTDIQNLKTDITGITNLIREIKKVIK